MSDCFDMSAALAIPRLISDYSAWAGHIPLAFTLIELARPGVLVELGTHKGDSYCAFCQGVEMMRLETRCTAVDTWAGDASAGFYDASVLAGLRAHHDPRYGGFSTLLQSTFDEAAARFPDRSIDLLHIDGNHDYAAVRRDFETWGPRLSDAAVVLFHDTQVLAENFGVHRLWKELAATRPHFEFLHGYGLGILAVGKNPPRRLREFLAYANGAPERVRSLFAALGQRIEFSRALGLLTRELTVQVAAANRWRGHLHGDLLPAPPFAGSGAEALAPDALDAKAWLDRLGWYAVHISHDFAHSIAVASQIPPASPASAASAARRK